ncbi:MAG: CDP-alcohol phosphatidyltransferase family protein [archaeon]|nr:CDP-alcohol phosphatidyltransferase family protein [archaeon]
MKNSDKIINFKNLFFRNLANLLSLSRIILSLFLLLTVPLSLNFFIIYLLAAFTDVLDGYLAKNIFSTSEFGAKLDSFADLVFFLSFLIVLYPVLIISYGVLIWILIIVFIKLLSLSIAFIKYKQVVLVHTLLNKATGLFLVLIPLGLLIIPQIILLNLMCLIASISAIEELLIILLSKNVDFNIKSIFYYNFSFF